MPLLEAVFGQVAIVGGKILYDVWQEWRKSSQRNRGVAVNAEGQVRRADTPAGYMSDATVGAPAQRARKPILMTGRFLADNDFIEFTEILLDPQDRRVLLFVSDAETGDSFLFESRFGGYGVALWPGTYDLYAFIMDPADNEVIGIGYPLSRDLDNPNPVILEGEGPLSLDFAVFDAETEDGLEPGSVDEAAPIDYEETAIGNRKTRVYHADSCVSVQRMAAANLVVFGNAGDAEVAGYSPCAICGGSSEEEQTWIAGAMHPEYPHLIASPREGEWLPAPGYIWLNNQKGDYRVRWSPGEEHSDHPNVVASRREGGWNPAPGYEWATKTDGDFRVRRIS